MGWRGVVAMALALSGLMSGVQAQPWQPGTWRTDWWRNGATLDMDFANNRYMVSLTTPATYTSLSQFITAVSGTFTRAGANETATGDPFYLSANQSFVSRATSTTQLTATGSPFYADASQAFYSRASSATYIDSSGVVQTAAANVARTNYIYNGSTWVSGGTLLEPARTNAIDNGYFTGAATGIIGTMSTVSGTGGGLPNKWGVSGWSPNNWGLNTQIVGLGTSNGLRYIDIRYYGTASGTNGSSWTGLYPGAPNQVAASSGQSWSGSIYLAVVSGSLTNINRIAAGISCRNVSGSSIEANNPIITDTSSLTSVLTRYSASLTCTTASTTYVALNAPSVNLQNGPIDVTFRLAGPQLELGASPTSYIATSGSTVTRAADVYTQETASYFNSAGVLKFATAGAARADYNPSTLAYRGILAEPARTNLIPYSADISGSTKWQQNGSPTLIFNTPSPDGGLAYAISSTAAFSGVYKGGTLSVTPGASYTETVFVKNISGSPAVRFGSDNVNAAGVGGRTDIDINTLTGSVTSVGAGVESYSVSPASNGWFRVAIGFTAATSSYSTVLYNSSALPSVNAVWGIQLEQGSSPTSYIPTSGTPASRAADVYTSGYSGTYFDAGGTLRNAPANTPRLDYDPSTSEPKGVLIEEARTNYVAYSTDYSRWTTSYGDLVAGDVAPDGIGRFGLCRPSTSFGLHYCAVGYAVSTSPSTQYTLSFYAKKYGAYDKVMPEVAGNSCTGGARYSPMFNLTSVTITAGSSPCSMNADISASITPIGNGVYRCSVAWTTSATTMNRIPIYPMLYGGYAGDGASGVQIWGAQLEQGAFPTSYIPTSGSTVTRPSDTLCLSTSGWYNSGAGSVYGDFYGEGDSTGSARVFSIGSASPLTFNNSNSNLIHWPGPAGVSGVTASRPISASIFVPLRAIATWDDSGPLAKLSAQGLVAHSGSYIAGSYAGPTACIGQAVSKLYYLNSWVRRIGYFPNAQPDYSLPDYTR